MSESLKKAQAKYNQSDKGKDRNLDYDRSEKGRKRKRRYAQNLSPEQKEKQRGSKRLSARRKRWKDKHGNLDGFSE